MYNVIPNEYKYIKINLGSDWGYLDGGSGVYLNKNYIITTNINTYIRWRYVNYHLINENTQKCISISSDGNSLILEDYIQDSKNQIFESKNNIADGPHTPNQILDKDFPGGMSDMLYAYAQVFFDVKKCFKKASVRNIQADSYLDAFPKVETNYLKWKCINAIYHSGRWRTIYCPFISRCLDGCPSR